MVASLRAKSREIPKWGEATEPDEKQLAGLETRIAAAHAYNKELEGEIKAAEELQMGKGGDARWNERPWSLSGAPADIQDMVSPAALIGRGFD